MTRDVSTEFVPAVVETLLTWATRWLVQQETVPDTTRMVIQFVNMQDNGSPRDLVVDALCVDEGASPSQDQIDTLVDLARDGDEATFRELASLLGVAADSLDAMWTGTVARLKPRVMA